MYYLSDANYQTDNPPHTNNPSLDSFCYKGISRPGLELGVRVSTFAFSQRLFWKAHVHPRCIACPVLQKKKHFAQLKIAAFSV